LPSDKRLAETKRLLAYPGGPHDRLLEALRQCTLVDDAAVAEWIFEHINDTPLSDPNLRATLAKIVARSQLGGFMEERFLGALRAGNYEYSSKPQYRIARTKQPLAIPGLVSACDWLRKKYQHATTDSQRAVALLAVAQLNHKTAVDAATGAIEAADKHSEPLQVAVSIVLSDAPVVSAQRANMLLSHRVPAIYTAALEYLAYPGVVLQGEKRALSVVVNNPSVLPGFWRVKEKLPTDKLHKLAESADEIEEAQAKLLLVASGEHIERAGLKHALPAKYDAYSNLCFAAALAKAGRSDHEAVEHYTSTYSNVASENGPHDTQIIAALYETLRDLTGDDVAELRRRIRNEKGAKLFNNNNNENDAGDPVFGSTEIQYSETISVHVSQ
jgi:hypothetical protein